MSSDATNGRDPAQNLIKIFQVIITMLRYDNPENLSLISCAHYEKFLFKVSIVRIKARKIGV